MVRLLGVALRVAGVLGGCAVTVAGAWRLARAPLGDLTGPVREAGPGAVAGLPLDVVVAGLCAAALLGCALWLLAATTLLLVAYGARPAGPGHPKATALARAAHRAVDRAAVRACPRLLHRAVAACLGVAVATGVAGPATADPARSPDLTGLALPDRTTGATPVAASTVVVRPGDSLWSIAAARLPDGAPDTAVTAAWHRLHRANLARIGADPDLILPGTRLVVPAPDASDRKDTS